jgi:protocatechuate 3,4-dioxygenase beta subunit
MSRFFLASVVIFLLLCGSGYAQWQFVKNFPNDNFKGGQGCHGLAVDRDGKIWIQLYDVTDSVVVSPGTPKKPTRVIYVFNPDGTPAPFSPIKTITVGGIPDSMTTPPNLSNRGLRADHQGNILACSFDRLFRLNYKTGAGMNKTIPRLNASLTAPAVDAYGNIFTAQVIAGVYPIQIFDKDFNLLGAAIDTSKGFSRSFEVAKDGNTIYWAGFTNHAVYKYTRPDEFSPFGSVPDTILKGFDAESVAWNSPTGYLWLSAGSYLNPPNNYPGAITSWSPNAWYAYNPETNQVVDSLKWIFNSPNNSFERPRAIAFSAGGDTAYVGCFGGSDYPPVQMFVRQDNLSKVALAIPDTLKGSPGHVIDVPVTLALDGNSVSALGANIKATNKILSFAGFVPGPIVPGERFSVNAPVPDSVLVAYADFGGGPIHQDGVLVTLRFRISPQAPKGVMAKLNFSEAFASDPQFKTLPITPTSGQVTVVIQPVAFSLPDTITGAAGDTVGIPLTLARGEHDIDALGAAIKATNGLISFLNFVEGAIVPAGQLNVNAPAPDSVRLAYLNLGGGSIAHDGVMATLHFRINPNAKDGEVSQLIFSNLSAADPAFQPLPVRGTPGKVTVVIQPVSIRGTKWNDLNGDGKKGLNEPGLKGWQINLTGDSTASTATDSMGNYEFAQLVPGTYTVSESLQTGWQQTFPPAPGRHTVTLRSGQFADSLNFGNWRPGSIHGTKWHDLNGDGKKDSNEPGLKDWQIELTGDATLSTTTDSLGNYRFTQLAPGNYTVAEVLQTGWEQTYPPAPGTHAVKLEPGQLADSLNFGNWMPGSIHGMKWHDLNGDGKKDSNEPGLKGWKIELIGDATLSTTTDSLGSYRFTQLAPGNYVVAEVLQTGWTQSFPSDSGTHKIILAPGQSVGNLDFGNWKTGEIRGLIWRDLNVNNSKETNEPGIKGWRVNLAGAANLSTTTDTLGNYAFTSLKPGTYKITVESRNKWRVTFPRDSVYTVQLVSAQVTGNIDFAIEPPVAVEERKVPRLPETFELFQNYPNPFWSGATSRAAGNPSTTIKYGVPRQSRIKIEVFNALGISVAVLVDEFHQPGYYTVKLERTGLPSGIYFYKLTAPNWVETKKMLLIR